MNNNDMKVRKATLDDIELLIQLRIDYLLDESKVKSIDDIEKIKIDLRVYLNKWIPNNGFIAYIAENNNVVLSTAFLSIVERPPRKANSSYLVGTVYNVYTYPEYRKQGIASKVMNALLIEAKSLNVAYVDLLSTDAGLPLYNKLGFEIIKDYTSMRLKIV